MVQSAAMLTSTALAHFLTTGCALMLMRRGPNRRLRLLTVTVGLMSLSQTIMLLQSGGLWQAASVYIGGLHQALIGGTVTTGDTPLRERNLRSKPYRPSPSTN